MEQIGSGIKIQTCLTHTNKTQPSVLLTGIAHNRDSKECKYEILFPQLRTNK